ncbi:MAG: hypothetical protein ABJA74_05905 [Lapillicoccus sp.]
MNPDDRPAAFWATAIELGLLASGWWRFRSTHRSGTKEGSV